MVSKSVLYVFTVFENYHHLYSEPNGGKWGRGLNFPQVNGINTWARRSQIPQSHPTEHAGLCRAAPEPNYQHGEHRANAVLLV